MRVLVVVMIDVQVSFSARTCKSEAAILRRERRNNWTKHVAIGVTNLGDECHLLCGEFCSLPTARHSVGVEVGFFLCSQ